MNLNRRSFLRSIAPAIIMTPGLLMAIKPSLGLPSIRLADTSLWLVSWGPSTILKVTWSRREMVEHYNVYRSAS